MNDLSWLLYLANVSGNIGVTMAFVLFVGGFITFCATIGFFASGAHEYEDDRKPFIKGFKWLGVVMTVAAIVGVLTPSRNTVYAIAASEMGERVLETETAGKAFKALDAWLDRQLVEASDAPAE